MSFSPTQLLASAQSHPLLLDLFCLKKLGADYYDWAAEALWTELPREARAPNISEVNKNKLQAIRFVHQNDLAFQRWEAFEKVIMTFNSVVPRFDVMQEPDLGQLILGVTTLFQLRSGELSDEVVRYMTAALLDHGVAYAPAPLEACNQYLRQKHPLFAETKAVIESGQDPPNEAVQAQVDAITSAKRYAAEASQRLLDQMGVVRDATPAPRFP